jgi:hypothetical protein
MLSKGALILEIDESVLGHNGRMIPDLGNESD